MSKLMVIPNKKEDINIILNKDIEGIILGVKDLSIYELSLDIDDIIEIASTTDKKEVGEYACDGQLPVVDIEHLAHRRFFAEERFGELAADDDAVPSRQHVTGIALLQFDREHMEERRVDAVDRYLHIFLADT